LIFDAGFGELFIGHEGCGAVKAALAARTGASEPSRISLLLENILPGLRDLPPQLASDERARVAVEANVRWSMHQLRCRFCARRKRHAFLTDANRHVLFDIRRHTSVATPGNPLALPCCAPAGLRHRALDLSARLSIRRTPYVRNDVTRRRRR